MYGRLVSVFTRESSETSRKRAKGREEHGRERERKGKYKSSERGKGKETEGEMVKKVTTPDVGSRAKLCM